MEPSRAKSSFRIFGIHSIFFKTLLSLVLLCVVLMVFFNQVLSRMVLNAQKEKEQSANLTALHQIADSVDLTISVMAQGMEQTVWSSDIIGFLINPYKRTPERDYRIVRILNNHTRGSGLVRGAYVYSPLNNIVYDSNGQVTELDAFAHQDALSAHLAERGRDQDASGDLVTRLQVIDGELFIFADLIVSHHLGTLFFALDSRALYRTISSGAEAEDEAIFVYDESGLPVFTAASAPDIPPDFEDHTLFLERDSLPAHSSTALFYLAVSRERGWRYLRPIDRNKLELGMRDLLRLLLPVLVALLGISALFTAYITSTIYKPINRLMQSIAHAAAPSDRKSQARTEIDYLELAYQDTLGRESALSGLISNITSDMLEHLMRGLLLGKEVDEAHLREILAGIGAPIAVDDRYCVVVGMTKSPENRPSTSTEANLYYVSIRQILEAVRNPACRVIPVSTDIDSIVIVFSCPADCSVTAFKQSVSETLQEIERHVRHYPYQFSMGRGQIYNHVYDLKYSYREALEELHYILYSQDAGEEGAALQDSGSRQQDHYYISNRAAHIIQAVSENREEEALRLADRVVDEIASPGREPGRARSLCGLLIDELMERLVTYQVSDDELASLRQHRLPEGSDNDAEIVRSTKTFCREAIRIIGIYSHKNQYKYVSDAKDYIAENYADSSLSLNDVSAHAGINSSYLSELFGEIARQPFTDYLSTYRVDKSKLLLANTGLTVKEIGFRCGFNSAQNYIRVFKRITGMTPGQYRDLGK